MAILTHNIIFDSQKKNLVSGVISKIFVTETRFFGLIGDNQAKILNYLLNLGPKPIVPA
jgi:hypothetical protein